MIRAYVLLYQFKARQKTESKCQFPKQFSKVNREMTFRTKKLKKENIAKEGKMTLAIFANGIHLSFRPEAFLFDAFESLFRRGNLLICKNGNESFEFCIKEIHIFVAQGIVT